MFEKEAEEYAQGMAMYYKSAHGSIPSQFEKYLRKAVEYGYNKANEWRDLRKDPNDLPTESMKPSLVKDEFGNLIVAYYSLELKSWWSTLEPDFGIEYEIPVVRWKEIVLSKESE